MRIRGLLATSALATSALFGMPVAAEEPDSCMLLEDPLNDTAIQGRPELGGFVVQPDVDLVSADVSTDESTLYAVIRVQSLQAYPPVYPRNGETKYRLEFASASRRYFVQVPSGYPATLTSYPYHWPWATAGRVGGRSYHVTSWTDHRAGEIYVEAPLSVFGRGSLAAGTLVGDLRATAVRTYTDHGQLAPGVSSRVSVGDTATGGAAYVVGAPSCITPDRPEWSPEPEPEPTHEPTHEPKPKPTPEPTHEPTPEPTQEPEPTQQPTPEPTQEPEPTQQPTEPTGEPTPAP